MGGSNKSEWGMNLVEIQEEMSVDQKTKNPDNCSVTYTAFRFLARNLNKCPENIYQY